MHITLLSRSSTKGKQFGGSGIKYFIDCIEDIHKESCFEIIRNIKNKKVLYAKNKEDFFLFCTVVSSVLEMISYIQKFCKFYHNHHHYCYNN